MSKKIIITAISLTLVFVFIFAACNESIYTDPSTGKKFILVTDEDGSRVYSDDGELLVYETDANGKIVTDEDGNKVTEGHGFIGQIEENGTVDDYSYSIELPSGWKTTDSKGSFENKSKKETLSISVVKYTYNDYYNLNKKMYDNIIAAQDQLTGDESVTVDWKEDIEYNKSNTKTPLFTMIQGDVYTALVFFQNNGNTYKISYTGSNTDEGKADFNTLLGAISYKQHIYYDDITSVSTESESTTAAPATTK